jgi:D-arabinose 1-dehydrogenase-like Zn-dependent alcohol dehydrogenase
MKAVRLRAYGEPLAVDEVAEPEITGPNDVIVRVGGSACAARTWTSATAGSPT